MLTLTMWLCSEAGGRWDEMEAVGMGEEEEWWMGGLGSCAVSQHQGRRAHQEDRLICMPHLLLPALPGESHPTPPYSFLMSGYIAYCPCNDYL